MLLTLTGRKTLSRVLPRRRGGGGGGDEGETHGELVYFVPVLSSRARLCLEWP